MTVPTPVSLVRLLLAGAAVLALTGCGPQEAAPAGVAPSPVVASSSPSGPSSPSVSLRPASPHTSFSCDCSR